MDILATSHRLSASNHGSSKSLQKCYHLLQGNHMSLQHTIGEQSIPEQSFCLGSLFLNFHQIRRKPHDTMPSHRTSHIRSSTLIISSRSQTRHRAKLSDKKNSITPHPLDTHPSSIQTHQLLLKARNLATTESQRTAHGSQCCHHGRHPRARAPPKATVQPYRCIPNRTHLRPVQEIYTCKDLGRMELYRAKRAAIVKLSTRLAYGVTKLQDFCRMVYHSVAAESRWKESLSLSIRVA